jgi:hypothetical protein
MEWKMCYFDSLKSTREESSSAAINHNDLYTMESLKPVTISYTPLNMIIIILSFTFTVMYRVRLFSAFKALHHHL